MEVVYNNADISKHRQRRRETLMKNRHIATRLVAVVTAAALLATAVPADFYGGG